MKRKIITTIIIIIFLFLYSIVYFGLLIYLVSGIWKFVLGFIATLFLLTLIKVGIDRIKEIKEDEDNDISKY